MNILVIGCGRMGTPPGRNAGFAGPRYCRHRLQQRCIPHPARFLQRGHCLRHCHGHARPQKRQCRKLRRRGRCHLRTITSISPSARLSRKFFGVTQRARPAFPDPTPRAGFHQVRPENRLPHQPRRRHHGDCPCRTLGPAVKRSSAVPPCPWCPLKQKKSGSVWISAIWKLAMAAPSSR